MIDKKSGSHEWNMVAVAAMFPNYVLMDKRLVSFERHMIAEAAMFPNL